MRGGKLLRILAVELYGGVWYTVYMVGDDRGNLEECLRDMKEYNIKISTAFLLVVAYFGVMLFYTLIWCKLCQRLYVVLFWVCSI